MQGQIPIEPVPNTVTDWVWWVVSVVVVGLAINLISSFVYPKIEKFVAQRSSKRRVLLEQKENKFEQEILELRQNPVSIVSLKIDVVLIMLRMIIYIAILILVEGFLSQVIYFIGYFTRIYGEAAMLYTTIISGFIVLALLFVEINKLRRVLRLLRIVS